MSKPEYLTSRCCMCPQIGSPEAKCPAGHPCRFVKAYRDDQGRVLFVTDAFAGYFTIIAGYFTIIAGYFTIIAGA